MVDYAISAVGRTEGAERLISTATDKDVRNFEEIGSRGENNPWNKIDGFHDSFTIIQEPSSVDSQLNTTITPWSKVASSTVDRLDHIQHHWRSAERELFSSSISSRADLSTKDGVSNLQATLRDMLKSSYKLFNGQVRLALVSSAAGTIKTSISTLYRQQG